MQSVVTRVAAAALVASKAVTRTTLEAAKQFAKDCATAAQSTAVTTTTEQDVLATRLAQAEAEIERLQAAAMSANETTEKATTAITATEAAASDATQDAAREKAALEAKVGGAGVKSCHHQSKPLGGQSPVLRGDKQAPSSLRGSDAAAGRQLQVVTRP
jgi:2-oxoglutarate dehydrogenase complex dehydrogenase (E1) component-like enzyme